MTVLPRREAGRRGLLVAAAAALLALLLLDVLREDSLLRSLLPDPEPSTTPVEDVVRGLRPPPR